MDFQSYKQKLLKVKKRLDNKEIDEIPLDARPKMLDFDFDKDSYVIVSYSRKDFVEVYLFLAHLYSEGYRFWYDNGMKGTEKWLDEYNSKFENPNCLGTITFFSDNYISDSTKEELEIIYNVNGYVKRNVMVSLISLKDLDSNNLLINAMSTGRISIENAAAIKPILTDLIAEEKEKTIHRYNNESDIQYLTEKIGKDFNIHKDCDNDIKTQDIIRNGSQQTTVSTGYSMQNSTPPRNTVAVSQTNNASILEEQLEKQAEATASLGIMALNTQDYKAAIDFFNEILRNSPDHIGAYLGLMRATSTKEKAKPYIEKIKTFPEDDILEYIKEHRDIIGDITRDDNMLTRTIYYLESESISIKLLENGVSGKASNALYYAIKLLHSVPLTKHLLKNGADAEQVYTCRIKNTLFVETVSLLYIAFVKVKSFELSKLLIDAGANVNFVYHKYAEFTNGTKSPTGSWSLLNEAVRNQSYEMAECLLQHGADPNVGRVYVKHYFENYTDGPHRSAESDFSNLSETIWNTKDKKMLELLLKYKADPNGKETRRFFRDIEKNEVFTKKAEYLGKSTKTALCDAIAANNLDMVNLLLLHNADPNTVYEFQTPGWIPPDQKGVANTGSSFCSIPVLGVAIAYASEDVVAALLDRGATFDTFVNYNKKNYGEYSIDSFPLNQLSFQKELSTSMENLIKNAGWKGSKKGLFKKEHTVWYRI